MPRRTAVDWDAVDTAAQLARISRAVLLELGVPASTISFRCGPNGPWETPLPGVVNLTTGISSPHQRIREALLYAGDDAVVTGLAACRLYGLRNLPEDGGAVHMLIRHEQRRLSVGHALIERTTRMPVARSVAGLPVAPVARAVLDAARRMRRISDIRALLAEAVQRGLTAPHVLRAELERGSARGSARVRAVLAELEDGVRSRPEAEARDLARSIPELPTMMWNPGLFLPNGTFLARPDGWLDEVALAWEINSFGAHADPDAFEWTERRQALMTAHGAIVVTTTPREVRENEESARANLRGGYEAALARPRPPIVARPWADGRRG